MRLFSRFFPMFILRVIFFFISLFIFYLSRIRDNMKELSYAFRDNFRHPLKAAGLWLSHVIKFRGDHLRPVVHELYTYQYYLIDVSLFLLCVFLLPFALLFFLLRCLCRCALRVPRKIIGSFSSKKEKDE